MKSEKCNPTSLPLPFCCCCVFFQASVREALPKWRSGHPPLRLQSFSDFLLPWQGGLASVCFCNFMFLHSSHTKLLKFLSQPVCSLFFAFGMLSSFAYNVSPAFLCLALGSGLTKAWFLPLATILSCSQAVLDALLCTFVLPFTYLITFILCYFEFIYFHLTRKWAVRDQCLCCIYCFPHCLEQDLKYQG